MVTTNHNRLLPYWTDKPISLFFSRNIKSKHDFLQALQLAFSSAWPAYPLPPLGRAYAQPRSPCLLHLYPLEGEVAPHQGERS